MSSLNLSYSVVLSLSVYESLAPTVTLSEHISESEAREAFEEAVRRLNFVVDTEPTMADTIYGITHYSAFDVAEARPQVLTGAGLYLRAHLVQPSRAIQVA